MMLVVLFALVGVAVGSWAPAQPAHLPALYLDPHGRPLETAEVINARALHLQAKALEHSYLPLSHGYLGSPLLAGHYLKKRSLGYLAPIISTNYIGGAAVSHQSRIDVQSSPAVVAHSVISPIVSHSVLSSPLISAHSAWPAYGAGHYLKKRSLGYLAAPIIAPHISTNYIGGSALTHQSRVDVHSSPAIVSQSVISPLISHAVSPVVSAYSAWPAYGHGHLLKKRSLGYAIPAALSHQARVDVISGYASPLLAHAAPIAVAHAIPAAVSHQSRVDYRTSPALVAQSVISPLAYSAAWTAPHGLNSLALSHW